MSIQSFCVGVRSMSHLVPVKEYTPETAASISRDYADLALRLRQRDEMARREEQEQESRRKAALEAEAAEEKKRLAIAFAPLAVRRIIRNYRADCRIYRQLRIVGENPVPPMGWMRVVTEVIRSVAAAHDVTAMDIRGNGRTAPVVVARHLAIWMVAKETPLSMPAIGRLFGDRNHTTILHAIRKVNDLRGENVRGTGGLVRSAPVPAPDLKADRL